jgi:hypothetical protein
MPRISAAEFREGVKKMIVPGYPRRRYVAAHRERIDQRIIKVLILERLIGRYFSVLARRLSWTSFRRMRRFAERKRHRVDAQSILGSGANPGFGVDSAAEMIVQIGALGHVHKKRV